jgi:hypothetical protein
VANLFSEVLDKGAVKAHEDHQVELEFVLEVLGDLRLSLIGQDCGERIYQRRQEQRKHKLDFKKVHPDIMDWVLQLFTILRLVYADEPCQVN